MKRSLQVGTLIAPISVAIGCVPVNCASIDPVMRYMTPRVTNRTSEDLVVQVRLESESPTVTTLPPGGSITLSGHLVVGKQIPQAYVRAWIASAPGEPACVRLMELGSEYQSWGRARLVRFGLSVNRDGDGIAFAPGEFPPDPDEAGSASEIPQ